MFTRPALESAQEGGLDPQLPRQRRAPGGTNMPDVLRRDEPAERTPGIGASPAGRTRRETGRASRRRRLCGST